MQTSGDLANALINARSRQDRVRESFPQSVNSRIDRETEGRMEHVINQGPEAISRRIEALEHEWDIDRALMANFAILGSASFSAGLLKSRRWMFLFRAQMMFLLYHSIKGWCPPRFSDEETWLSIEGERQVLVGTLRNQFQQHGRQEKAS